LIASNIISDIELAIAGRSSETGAMLHRITELFLIHAGHYSADQLSVYDDVLELLIDKVEVSARAALAQRLAPLAEPPAQAIQALARDDAIEVAAPVLAQSPALDDDTLADIATRKGWGHLVAIATRLEVSEAVSDKLIASDNKAVLTTLVNNSGAKISNSGFGELVKKSTGDDLLSECVASRKDIPEHHFRDLVSKASDIVRHRLMTNNPELYEIIQETLPDAQAPAQGRVAAAPPAPSKDYRTAELVVRSKPLTEASVIEFARKKQIEEVVVALALHSNLSFGEIERLFLNTWSSPCAVILKGIGFHLSTLDLIYAARLGPGEAPRNDFIQAKAEFIALRRATAERIMRFFRTRRAAGGPAQA
jgi:uncharacterized protein (DUF2336 family)